MHFPPLTLYPIAPVMSPVLYLHYSEVSFLARYEGKSKSILFLSAHQVFPHNDVLLHSVHSSSICSGVDVIPVLSLFNVEQQLQASAQGTQCINGAIFHATVPGICLSIHDRRPDYKECLQSMEPTPIQKPHSRAANRGIFLPFGIARDAVLYTHSLSQSSRQ